ncbi:MAG: response regulator, partial [Candidatus Altiarchaeota archaeon]
MPTRTRAVRVERKPTVFVIDDNPRARFAYTELLRDSGFDVESLSGSEEGLVDAVASRADAVLLDKNLRPEDDALAGTGRGVRSGFELAAQIREKAPWVKIVFLSAEGVAPPKDI